MNIVFNMTNTILINMYLLSDVNKYDVRSAGLE
jgi:hypothetical protein